MKPGSRGEVTKSFGRFDMESQLLAEKTWPTFKTKTCVLDARRDIPIEINVAERWMRQERNRENDRGMKKEERSRWH